MKNSTKNKGFTLIELLVVISIISLLSSIVLASVQDARSRAQQTAYRQYLGEVVMAIELYRLENDTLPTQGHINNLVGVGNPLGDYIEETPIPSFVYFPTVVPSLTHTPLTLSNYSCGAPKLKESYMIFFTSYDNDLTFPKMYSNDGKITANRGGQIYYCVSDLVN